MKNISGLKLLAGGVTLIVVAVVVAGLFVAGSPAEQRAKAIDQRRVDALSQTANALDAYYAVNFDLPESLADLAVTEQVRYYPEMLNDPETRQPHEYRRVNATTYELCASFAHPAPDESERGYSMPKPMPPATLDAGNWYWHDAGRVCRTGNAAARAPYHFCGVGNLDCPSGSTCMKLPNLGNAICVKHGMDCAAAGCPDTKCAMSKSLPPQVICPETAEAAAAE